MVQAGKDAERVSWESLDIPLRTAPLSKRIGKEFSTLRTILRVASRESAASVLLCSATEVGFLLLKLLLTFSGLKIPVLVVMHGVLATLVPSSPVKRLSPRLRCSTGSRLHA